MRFFIPISGKLAAVTLLLLLSAANDGWRFGQAYDSTYRAVKLAEGSVAMSDYFVSSRDIDRWLEANDEIGVFEFHHDDLESRDFLDKIFAGDVESLPQEITDAAPESFWALSHEAQRRCRYRPPLMLFGNDGHIIIGSLFGVLKFFSGS